MGKVDTSDFMMIIDMIGSNRGQINQTYDWISATMENPLMDRAKVPGFLLSG